MSNAPEPTSQEPAHDPEVLELAQRIFGLVRHGDKDTVATYLDMGVPPDLTDDQGDTLVTLAACHGHAEVVRTLLAHGAEAGRADATGRTPLAGAVSRGATDVIDVLLDAGADPEAGSPSAVETARAAGRQDLVERLTSPGGNAG